MDSLTGPSARRSVIYVAGQDGHSPARVLAGLAAAAADVFTVLVGERDDERIGPLRAAAERLGPVAVAPDNAAVPAPAALAQVGTPGVLKPVYGAGSTWAFRVDRAEDLAELVAQSWVEMSSDSYVHRSQLAEDTGFVYETFLTGNSAAPDPRLADYCSVEGVVVDDRVRILGVSDRFWPCPPFRETGVLFPSMWNRPAQDAMVDLARAAADAVGMRAGAFHVEVKNTPTGPVLIEFNPRPGGPIPLLWERLTGGNFIEAYVAALHGDGSLFDRPLRGTAGEHLIYADGDTVGRLDTFVGLARAADIPGIEGVEQWHAVGDLVNPHEGDYSALGRAWSHAGTPHRVLTIDSRLRDAVQATLAPLA